MPMSPIAGTDGYAETAEAFFEHADRVAFADVHRAILHLIPARPARVLDIGAGSGRDAAAFVAMGHRVVAIEPVTALRHRAATVHRSSRIEWLDGNLPELACLAGHGEGFDLVMLTAVWMHLDASQRRRAMPAVARLVAPGGRLILSLRQGPAPRGRRMFDVTAEETVALATRAGLALTLQLDNQPSAFARTDVT